MRQNLGKYNGPKIVSRGVPLCPFNVFQCKDGMVALVAGSDEEFQCLCQAMGRPELAENERFAPFSIRIKSKNAAALHKIIREWTKQKSVAQIDRLGARFGFAVAPLADALSHPFEPADLQAWTAVFG